MQINNMNTQCNKKGSHAPKRKAAIKDRGILYLEKEQFRIVEEEELRAGTRGSFKSQEFRRCCFYSQRRRSPFKC